MAIINDYNELLKLFSQITATETASFTNALAYCKDKATAEIMDRLTNEVTEHINNVVKNSVDLYNKFLKEGKDAKQIVYNWKPHTPCDIYAKILQALNLPEPATNEGPQHADFEQLAQYIDAGFQLFPCIPIKTDNGTKYLPITLNGKIALYDTDEQKQAKDRHGITDKELLQELCNKTRTIKDEHGRNHAIELFRVFSLDNRYIVIDIDTHDGKANGLVQWNNYIKRNNLSGYFKDLQNFPCYVESANGGKHLYFKLPYDIPAKIKNIASSVEISTKDHGETAGGSYRKETKNKLYVLHGKLDNAPVLPLCIYKDMQPEPPKPANSFYKRPLQAGNATAKWNTSTNGIVEKARQKHGNEQPHDFAYWICKYFDMANKDGRNYNKSEIETVLFSLPELAQHDRNDTQGVINSFNFN